MKRKKDKKSPRKSDNTHQSHISRFFFKAGTSNSSSTDTENSVETETKNQKAAKSQVGQYFEKNNESQVEDTTVFVESENESNVQNPTVSFESESTLLFTGNALAWVLWDITFCTRKFW